MPSIGTGTIANAVRLYQKGVGLKEGEGRNLRDASKMFKRASESGHAEETKELTKCYLHGRGCERDAIKAAEFRDSKLNRKWRRKGE